MAESQESHPQIVSRPFIHLSAYNHIFETSRRHLTALTLGTVCVVVSISHAAPTPRLPCLPVTNHTMSSIPRRSRFSHLPASEANCIPSQHVRNRDLNQSFINHLGFQGTIHSIH